MVYTSRLKSLFIFDSLVALVDKPLPISMVLYQVDKSIHACSSLQHLSFVYVDPRHNWHILYKKRLLLRYIHHFESDLINNTDHMRISGTEPSSVILSKTE